MRLYGSVRRMPCVPACCIKPSLTSITHCSKHRKKHFPSILNHCDPFVAQASLHLEAPSAAPATPPARCCCSPGNLIDLADAPLSVVISSVVGGRMLAGRTTERHSCSLQGAGMSETESERRFEFPSPTMQACRYVLIACRDDLISLFDDFSFNDSVPRHFAGFEQPAGNTWPVPQGIVRRDPGHRRGEIASALPCRIKCYGLTCHPAPGGDL